MLAVVEKAHTSLYVIFHLLGNFEGWCGYYWNDNATAPETSTKVMVFVRKSNILFSKTLVMLSKAKDVQECMLLLSLYPLTFCSVFLTSLPLKFRCRLEDWRQEHLGNNTSAIMLARTHTPTHQLCNALQRMDNVLIDCQWFRNRGPSTECKALCIGKCSCQNHRQSFHYHWGKLFGFSVAYDSFQREWLNIGTSCPGKCWNHCPWNCSRNLEMWYWGTWVNRHGGVGLTVGLDYFSGFFQTLWFHMLSGLWPLPVEGKNGDLGMGSIKNSRIQNREHWYEKAWNPTEKYK